MKIRVSAVSFIFTVYFSHPLEDEKQQTNNILFCLFFDVLSGIGWYINNKCRGLVHELFSFLWGGVIDIDTRRKLGRAFCP